MPHSLVAAPAGVDLQALGVADEPVVSDGEFLAVFEYEVPTAFFPTTTTEVLGEEDEYVRCEDLEGIRIATNECAVFEGKGLVYMGQFMPEVVRV